MLQKKPIEAKVLGRQVSYSQTYSPNILVAVPRSINREKYHLKENDLPFCGLDVWHAYELSFLTQKGLPVVGVLKIIYSANSEFLVESKSLKLYLNSFNMERFGESPKEGLQKIIEIIKEDLHKLLKADVKVSYFKNDTQVNGFDFDEYALLEKESNVNNLDFNKFSEAPELLKTETSDKKHVKVSTNLLRSNCKITHQPDWGSAFIYIKGEKIPQTSSLLQYLVSIRNENHFHEEICEMIYQRLWTLFNPEELMVTCIYTRRGGIDICPTRASKKSLLPEELTNEVQLSAKLLRQ